MLTTRRACGECVLPGNGHVPPAHPRYMVSHFSNALFLFHLPTPSRFLAHTPTTTKVFAMAPTTKVTKKVVKNDDAKKGAKKGAKKEDAKETAKKDVKKKPYVLKTSTPFPEYPHPTPEECEEVNRLLTAARGEQAAPSTIPDPSLTVTGCGEVPSVLDALARTLLSSATSVHNAGLSFDGLVKRFGVLTEGIGKGSVDWYAVRNASLEEVETAMMSGGLAKKKAFFLKELLDSVYEENDARLTALLSEAPEKKEDDSDKDSLCLSDMSSLFPWGDEALDPEHRKSQALSRLAQNLLSLDRLHDLSTADAMAELTKHKGIGPKIAACVLLFCLRRPCFAIDTHIFRICSWLGWIPNTLAVTEDKAFEHLDAKVPDHLKYSLHQQFFFHGQECPRCRAKQSASNEGSSACVIEHLVNRSLPKPAKLQKVDNDAGTKRKATEPSDPARKRPMLARSAKKEIDYDNKENDATMADED